MIWIGHCIDCFVGLMKVGHLEQTAKVTLWLLNRDRRTVWDQAKTASAAPSYMRKMSSYVSGQCFHWIQIQTGANQNYLLLTRYRRSKKDRHMIVQLTRAIFDVSAHSKPFIMRVTSSSDPSLGRNPAAFAQSGFSLRYTQLPCVD